MSRPRVLRHQPRWHPTSRHRGARWAVLLVPFALVIAAAAPAAAADDDGNQLAHDRALAAETASRLVAAEADATDLEHEIATTTTAIGSLQHEARRLRDEVRRRAAELYTTSGTHLDAVVQSSNTLTGARAAQLTEVAGRSGMAAAARLSTVTDQLQHRAAQLGDARAALERNRQELEAQREELARRIDDAVAASRQSSSSSVRTAAVVTPSPAGASDDVWLHFRECTFAHESGGDYGIVSPDGLYYGAWQFLPSTWNSIASGWDGRTSSGCSRRRPRPLTRTPSPTRCGRRRGTSRGVVAADAPPRPPAGHHDRLSEDDEVDRAEQAPRRPATCSSRSRSRS